MLRCRTPIYRRRHRVPHATSMKTAPTIGTRFCSTLAGSNILANHDSTYRTANLYFKARNGTYKRVPQIANQFNDDDNAGLTVYYTSPGPNATTAFKPVHLDMQ